MPKNVRTDTETASVFHNTAALLARLRQDAHLSPSDRAMASIYSSVVDRRGQNRQTAPAVRSGQ